MSGSKRKKKQKEPRKKPGAEGGASGLRSLEEEFAELEREIAVIRAQPSVGSGQQALMLKRLRAEWDKKAGDRADQSEWQNRVDEKMQKAFEGILAAGTHTIDARGKLTLKVKEGALQEQLAPALQSIVEGLNQLLDLKNFLSGVNADTPAPSTSENQEIVKPEASALPAQNEPAVKTEESK